MGPYPYPGAQISRFPYLLSSSSQWTDETTCFVCGKTVGETVVKREMSNVNTKVSTRNLNMFTDYISYAHKLCHKH